MASKSGDWELSKENVQPLRQGRRMDSLSNALEAEQKMDSLRQRQSDFELELRVYSGPDPLEVWCRYIAWIEQNFPKGGSEGNFFKVIHKCCINFSKDVRYANDERFLDIWLKLISMSTDPFALYQFMYGNKICCELAKFYVNWALELEEMGETTKADNIYVEGIQRHALPVDLLKAKHRLFLARMTATVPESWQSNGGSPRDEEKMREALNVLVQSGKKGHVAFNRVDHVKSDAPKILPLSQSPRANSMTHKVFQDENNPFVFPIQSTDGMKLSAISDGGKENERKAGKWTKSKLKLKSIVDDASTPGFTIHQEDCPTTQPASEKLNNKWNVPLSEKKLENSQILPLSSEENPKVVVAYCKEKLFCGGQEFSFEELRAYRWQQKQKIRIKKDLNPELRSEQDKIQTINKELFRDDTLKRNGEESNRDDGSQDAAGDSDFQLLKKNPSTNNSLSDCGRAADAGKDIDQQTYHETKTELNNVDPSVHLISPTIHTKEAFSAMMGLFNKSLNLASETDGDISESFREFPRIETEDVPFTIFSDDNVKTNLCPNFETENTCDVKKADVSTTKGVHQKSIPITEETTATMSEAAIVAQPSDDFSTSTCGCPVNDVTDFTVIPPINSNVFAELAKNVSTPIHFSNGIDSTPLVDTDPSGCYESLDALNQYSCDKQEQLCSSNSSQIHNNTVKIASEVDPFSLALISQFLCNVTPTICQRPGIKKMNCSLPPIKTGALCCLDSDEYKIYGKFVGGFAVIYKATIHGEEQKQALALKVQRPPCEWEFYIVSELKQRLQSLSGVIDVTEGILELNKAYIFEDCSVYVSKWTKYGTLLYAINTYKLEKSTMPEMLVLYFAVELMRIMQQMHECNIIHGDIKPDNILLTNLTELSADTVAARPEKAFHNKTKTVTLIDFGQSIDMSLFPLGTTFTQTVQTEDFVCPEMLDKRPWTYQIDYFGLLATIHCMLFGTYISIVKRQGLWTYNNKPKRYWNTELWQEFFNEWLNIPNCDELPNLDNWLKRFQGEFFKLQRRQDIRYLMHTLKVSVVENSRCCL